MKVLLVVIFVELFVVFVLSELSCSSHETCGACTSFAEESCVWCSQPTMTGQRCTSIADLTSRKVKFNCEVKHRVYPISKVKVSPPDYITRDFRGGKDAIQFVPHKLDIATRPGLVVNFDMHYKPAKDFPIDVYYLMDHSYTMEVHTKLLMQEGKKLYEELKSFTNNVRFGVGSFIEKSALPYADPDYHLAYSFKNHLSLTDEIEQFVDILASVPFGANYDDPEAGLDALMQAMTCDEELKWRKDARRIIILCTDNTYHSAGDGKMVDADVTNDMKCHLKNNSYDGQLTFDYPSVSQINKVATDGKFIIIFAAVNEVRADYSALANTIRGAKYAELKAQSNIVEIIRDAYLESVRVMKLSLDSNWPSNVKLSLEPDCINTENCKIVHNKILHIKAKLTVKNCYGERRPLLKIGPSNLMESLSIRLNVLCECECEKKSVLKSTQCSSNGSYQCGVCKCYEGRSGSKCQCSVEDTGISESHKCKANETDLQYCSSHGTCSCGKCDCKDDFSGTFCEFDDKACLRVNNLLCAGHGRCHLGKCNCFENWKGQDCNCPAGNTDCIDPYSKKICSGNGECVCGECVCAKRGAKEKSYDGAFCDSCDECADRRCKVLETIVECNYYHKTNCNKDIRAVVGIVNRTNMNAKGRRGEWCKKTLENGTSIVFRHYYDKNDRKLHIVIQDQLEVPPEADVWVPVGIAIGTVLLVGILTVIIWKILVDYYDAKEYDKFAREAKEAGFEVMRNPFYVDPSIEFANPTFQQ
ncbi:integrin beta-3 [Amyelois transitella]|uniref:integrin beta-3 n=1 Tax=Amyelois transitella TaxID=680683 RepID=UPI00067B2650|nr:integrin beta-3 [Amyelois transitella]